MPFLEMVKFSVQVLCNSAASVYLCSPQEAVLFSLLLLSGPPEASPGVVGEPPRLWDPSPSQSLASPAIYSTPATLTVPCFWLDPGKEEGVLLFKEERDQSGDTLLQNGLFLCHSDSLCPSLDSTLILPGTVLCSVFLCLSPSDFCPHPPQILLKL